MTIDFHIQTKTGRCEDPYEPSVAANIDISEDTTEREISQFYLHLKYHVRCIEQHIDENLGDGNEGGDE